MSEKQVDPWSLPYDEANGMTADIPAPVLDENAPPDQDYLIAKYRDPATRPPHIYEGHPFVGRTVVARGDAVGMYVGTVHWCEQSGIILHRAKRINAGRLPAPPAFNEVAFLGVTKVCGSLIREIYLSGVTEVMPMTQTAIDVMYGDKEHE